MMLVPVKATVKEESFEPNVRLLVISSKITACRASFPCGRTVMWFPVALLRCNIASILCSNYNKVSIEFCTPLQDPDSWKNLIYQEF